MKINNLPVITFLLILSLFLIIMNTHVSGQAAWTSSGPPGGYVNSISFSPSDQGVVFAGTISGVYKSTDDGETWSFAGLDGIEVNKILVDPKNADIVYAGVGKIPGYEMSEHDGLYKTIDAGEFWTKKYETWVTAIAIDPDNPNTLYIGTKSGEILKSWDGGKSWTLKHDESENETELVEINSIVVDHEASSNIFAGTGGGYRLYPWDGNQGFLKSTDSGETWTRKQIGTTTGDKGISLVITPEGHTPQTLFIISNGRTFDPPEFSEYKDIVYYSTDKGETWSGLYVPAYENYSARTLYVDPKDPQWIAVGTDNPDYPLIALNNSEMVWDDICAGLPKNEPSTIASSPNNPDITLTGYKEGKLYRSTNYAENWNIAGQGINNSTILDIEAHPLLSGTVLTAVKGNFLIQKTGDGGATWADMEDSPRRVNTIAIDTNDPSIVFTGGGSIYRSTDWGESWTYMRSLSPRKIKDIWVNPANSNIVLVTAIQAGSYSSVVYYGGVWRNTDGGTTIPYEWDFVFEWFRPKCMTSDPSNHNHVYLGVERIGYVFHSPDAGSSWGNISPGNKFWNNVNDIVVDSESYVYAATTEYEENEKDGIWKMEWKSDTTFLWSHVYRFEGTKVTALAIDRRTNPETLYAGTSDSGVFVSEDAGESWSEFNDGLGIKKITKLEISATEPKMLYAGTEYGGVWSILLGEKILIITAQAAENGSISPTDEVEVEYGGVQAFDILPDEGFRLAYIRIDGNEIDLETDENWNAESGQYTFSNVTEAHTIEVGFEDATAVKDVADQNELKVYPNPAKNELWIEFNYRGSDSPVIVLQNLQGQTLKQIPVNETGSLLKRMATHNLASGIYLLTVQGEEVFPVKRVMIEN